MDMKGSWPLNEPCDTCCKAWKKTSIFYSIHLILYFIIYIKEIYFYFILFKLL